MAEDRLDRLEAFLAQVSSVRLALADFLPSAEAGADGLADLTAGLEARLEMAAQTAASLTQSVETNHQHALAELGALSLAGTQVAEQAVGGARGRLADADAGFERGLGHAREEMTRSAGELAAASGQAGHAASELEEQHAEHGQGLAEAGSALRAGVLEAGEHTHAVGTESLASLEAARSYVVEGLDHLLGSAFAMFLDEMKQRLQPTLADSLGEVARTVLRAFDELDSLVESATGRLVEETEPVLRELAGQLEDWTREVGARLDDSTQDALRPYTAEVERHVEATRRGHEVASDVAQLAPQLATARQVADRIQDLLDVMNPFG